MWEVRKPPRLEAATGRRSGETSRADAAQGKKHRVAIPTCSGASGKRQDHADAQIGSGTWLPAEPKGVRHIRSVWAHRRGRLMRSRSDAIGGAPWIIQQTA